MTQAKDFIDDIESFIAMDQNHLGKYLTVLDSFQTLHLTLLTMKLLFFAHRLNWISYLSRAQYLTCVTTNWVRFISLSFCLFHGFTTHHINWQMIILPFIPILALIVQTSVSLNDLLKYQADSTDTETQVRRYSHKICDCHKALTYTSLSPKSVCVVFVYFICGFVCHFHFNRWTVSIRHQNDDRKGKKNEALVYIRNFLNNDNSQWFSLFTIHLSLCCWTNKKKKTTIAGTLRNRRIGLIKIYRMQTCSLSIPSIRKVVTICCAFVSINGVCVALYCTSLC